MGEAERVQVLPPSPLVKLMRALMSAGMVLFAMALFVEGLRSMVEYDDSRGTPPGA